MYTSMMLFALTGWLSQISSVAVPASWHLDYATAYHKGISEHKPLAVLISSGSGGWHKLSKEGSLGDESLRLLESSYVCVYVDVSTEGGQRLASRFEMGNGPGLVIGDRTGEVQSFRHHGELSNNDLENQLRRLARAAEPRQSYSAPARAYSYTPTVMSSSGSC